MNDAIAIAAEHIRWAQVAGYTAAAVCASVGVYTTHFVSWDDAKLAVALAWIEIAKTLRSAA